MDTNILSIWEATNDEYYDVLSILDLGQSVTRYRYEIARLEKDYLSGMVKYISTDNRYNTLDEAISFLMNFGFKKIDTEETKED